MEQEVGVTGRGARSGPRAWLGVDVGTQGVRAVLVDDSGRLLGEGACPLPGGRRDGALHEQDPEAWWGALCRAGGQALVSTADVVVAGLAVDSTSGTLVVTDAAGVPRGPGLMYDDARAGEQAARVQEAGRAVWESLGYRMQPTWALPKVLWLLEHGALSVGDRVAHQADVLLARLAGHPVATDTSSALKTGYDPVRGDWPREVLDALGIPGAVLPDVVTPGRQLGEVCPAAAEQSGIPVGTPLLAGMTDGCAAQIAARALTPGAWSSALGTTLVVKGSTAELLRDPTGAVYCHVNPDGGWLPGGASSTGAGVVAQDFPGADLAALTRRAASLDLPFGVVYPLSGQGERFPFVAPRASAFAVRVGSSEPERFAATLYGVALVERMAYDVLAGLGADTSGSVTFSGGATRNRWWNQLRADVLGRPALVPEGVQAALGMAVLAAAPPGRLGATAEAMVRIVEELHPDPGAADRHQEAYVTLRDALADRGWLDPATLGSSRGAP